MIAAKRRQTRLAIQRVLLDEEIDIYEIKFQDRYS